jgi:peptidoglycan biosynthesis protein MviN/MurJ (putative lipid II flippase)
MQKQQKQQEKQRPLGVSVIAILVAIGGIAFLIANGGKIGTATTGIGVSIISIAVSIAYLVMAFGLWKGKRWAWTITIVLSFIGIALGASSLSNILIVTENIGAILSVAINAVIIYYLYRPHVKAFFGKAISPSYSSGTATAANV